MNSAFVLYWLGVWTLRNVLLWPFDGWMLKGIMRDDWLRGPSYGWMCGLRRLHFYLIKRLKFSLVSCDGIIFFWAWRKHLVTQGYPIVRSRLILTSVSESDGRSFGTSTLMRWWWRPWYLSGSGADSMSADSLMRYENFRLALGDKTVFRFFWNFDGEIEILVGSIIDGDVMRE